MKLFEIQSTQAGGLKMYRFVDSKVELMSINQVVLALEHLLGRAYKLQRELDSTSRLVTQARSVSDTTSISDEPKNNPKMDMEI